MRLAISLVPSAQVTCPACWEYPIPTPPPLWIDTQEAPLAVFTKAFNSAQSATASDPSFIASVSRYGEATEPQSKWSRPMTMGPFNSPLVTSSLIANPNLSRSPYPSQHILDGNPWNFTFFCAKVIHRFRCPFSGNISSTSLSVRAISEVSPESAAQRNGPFPPQNKGRIYAGTNPGKS